MLKMLTTCVAFLSILGVALPAYSLSPVCNCSASAVTWTVSEELPCLQVDEEPLDVCYGNDLIVRLTNNCAFDVVIKSAPDLNGDGTTDRTIAPGETDVWQQVFEPILTTEGDTAVSISWTIEADGANHTLELSFVGTCFASSDDGGDGCRAGSDSSSPWFLGALLFALFALRRRSVETS